MNKHCLAKSTCSYQEWSKASKSALRKLLIFSFISMLLSGCARMGSQPGPLNAASDQRQQPDPYAEALFRALEVQALSGATQENNVYRITPTDLLEIQTYGYAEMNMMCRVNGDGEISFPPLGKIEVAGLSTLALEEKLQDKLRDGYLLDPHVTVLVREAHPGNVAIMGEVNKPGNYPLMNEKRLIDLLSEAGGLTELSGSVAFLRRKNSQINSSPGTSGASTTSPGASNARQSGTQRFKIYLDKLLLEGEEQWNLLLQPGDFISIPPAGSVHITGPGILQPGTYTLSRFSNTLRQIVDAAGGLKYEARKKITIIRRNEDNSEEVLIIDYGEILKNNANDLELQAHDQVITRTTTVKKIVGGVYGFLKGILNIGVGYQYRLGY